MYMNWYFRWGNHVLVRASQLHVAPQTRAHTTCIKWIDGTIPTTCATSLPLHSLSKGGIHPPSRAQSFLCFGCSCLGLGGVIGKGHGDVYDGDIVKFCHICYLCCHESCWSLTVAWDTNGPMATASRRHCCVSWHSRPVSCATIMLLRLRLLNLVL